MPSTISKRFKNAWNVFRDRDQVKSNFSTVSYGQASSSRPDRPRFFYGNERSIIASVYTKIAVDISLLNIVHVTLDDNDRLLDIKKSSLNDCLTVSANIDQTGTAFIQEVVMSLFDEGVIAIIPVDCETEPDPEGGRSITDVYQLRTGKIIQWYPQKVKVRAYNELTGQHEDLILSKKEVAIIENPFFATMNEPNSIAKRLIYKLNLLDSIDKQSGAGKLDIIIQLPYTIKSDARRQQADERRAAIEEQLTGSKYGIAYADATERITQLNRPVENNLMKQIEFLTRMLYSQLGMSDAVFNGTADEKEMLNYQNGTLEPVVTAIMESLQRTFLSKTARTQLQAIRYFRDPFRLVPVSSIADIADKFTRNEILSSNDLRAIIGYKPSKDPAADELRNKNLNQAKQPGINYPGQQTNESEYYEDDYLEDDIYEE